MTLIDLLKSDLERYYFYNNQKGRTPQSVEIIKCFCIPRCMLASLYRISHFLSKNGFKRSGKLITWLNFFLFNSEIDSACEIGPYLYFPHPGGIVIGAISIGSYAVIYHQVTIGATEPEYERYNRPIIGDNVIIGSGAKILGRIEVPSNAMIIANSLVTKSNIHNLRKI